MRLGGRSLTDASHHPHEITTGYLRPLKLRMPLWRAIGEKTKEDEMPQIIVVADRPNERGEGPVMLSERVSAADFESKHFAAHLVERLGWAVTDAHAAEQDRPARPQ
jgi:hypothetical protein